MAVAAPEGGDLALFIDALALAGALDCPDVSIHIAHAAVWGEPGRQAANLHFHSCPGQSSAFALWGTAVARADADYVAVLDIQVPPAPSWLERVRGEIAQGTPLFFGAVQLGWDGDDSRTVGYLAEYVQFHAPLRDGLREVPGNNLVGRRDLIAAHLGPLGFDKTILLRRLGLLPAAVEGMPVTYRKDFTLRSYLSKRVYQGRAFAASRHSDPGQPSRLLCIAFTPLLPLLRLWRINRATRGSHDLRRATNRLAHLLLLSEMAWSWGEFAGYVRPSRD